MSTLRSAFHLLSSTLLVWTLLGVAADALGQQPPAEGERSPPQKDALGDPLPEGALARFGTTRLRHPSFITSVMYARDGKTVFSTGYDRTIRVWDVETGKELAPFQGECSHDWPCALSPDGKIVASAWSHDGVFQLRMWDVAARRPIGDPIRIEGEHAQGVLTFSPDGKLLATAHGYRARLWDVSTGREVRKLVGQPRVIGGLSFSPDGKSLVSCGNNYTVSDGENTSLVLWDVTSGERLWQVQGPRGLASVTFLADGKTVAAGAFKLGSVTLYHAATGEQKAVLRQGGRQLAVSPNGKTLAIVCTPIGAEVPGGYDDSSAICLWDLAAGSALKTLVGHPAAVTGLAFSPDGKVLASGGEGVWVA